MISIKRNRTTVHIAGIEARTQGTGEDTGRGHVAYFAESTCSALTRGRLETDREQYETAAEGLEAARNAAKWTGRKLCKNCEKAAEASL